MSRQTIIQIERTHRSDAPNETLLAAAEIGTRAPEGALTGAVLCVAVVGAFGWLGGIGVLAIPGMGKLTAEGPGLAALCGIAVGATIGGIAGCLVGRRIPDLHRPRELPRQPSDSKPF